MKNNDLKITICPTPIGNLGDISERVRDVLVNADVVYCEDTRVTGRLLTHVGSHAKTIRLDENLMLKKVRNVIEAAQQGKRIVYCSDAGMPGISDPGQRLVSAARDSGISIEVLPGPCAAINAYVNSGFESSRFMFMGFFPKKSGMRKTVIDKLVFSDYVSIFYESPARLVSALSMIAKYLPDRHVCVCRELTKIHEEVFEGTAKEVYDNFCQYNNIKGEIILVVDCASKEELQQFSKKKIENAKIVANELALLGIKSGKISEVLQTLFGIPKNESYKISINSKKAHGK